jgi:hypothetical protein
MRQSEAWERWPEHRGHDLGMIPETGDAVCKTCDYCIVERGFKPPIERAVEVIHHPFFE